MINHCQNGRAPYKVISTIPPAVKRQGMSNWVHLSKLKFSPPEAPQVTTEEQYT